MVLKSISDTWGYVPRTTQNLKLVQVLFITGMRSRLILMWPRLCGAASKKLAMANLAICECIEKTLFWLSQL